LIFLFFFTQISIVFLYVTPPYYEHLSNEDLLSSFSPFFAFSLAFFCAFVGLLFLLFFSHASPWMQKPLPPKTRETFFFLAFFSTLLQYRFLFLSFFSQVAGGGDHLSLRRKAPFRVFLCFFLSP